MADDTLRRVQSRFLKEIFTEASSGFVLKGSMAMLVFFGPGRRTIDVDLDFPDLGKRTAVSLHNQVMRGLKAALQGSGVQYPKISVPGMREVSPRWKINGSNSDGEPFHMMVEVSRLPAPPGAVRRATVSGVSTFGLGTYYVDLYGEGTLAAMALAALLGRTAARDVTDLDLLLADHRPDDALIQWVLGQVKADPPNAVRAMEEKLAAMSHEFFRTEMLASGSLLARIDGAAWYDMRSRVREKLAEVLDGYALRNAQS